MSWDVFVQEIPPPALSIADIPERFKPGPIGKRADLIAGIQQIVQTADFTSPDWGKIDGPNYSIEVSMGDFEDVASFAFHIRGGDQAALLAGNILEHLGLRAFDPGSESGIFKSGQAGSRRSGDGGAI